MKNIISIILIGLSLSTSAQKTKYELDVEAIKSLEGCYKVTFDFAETFSPDVSYKAHNPQHSTGTEYVKIVEESANKIVLQHLLIVNDQYIIKHWRQDWLYENTDIYEYDKENRWVKKVLTVNEVKGQWTQKVYQVDDSPRYEGSATWVHVDGSHSWESSSDAPLPRREYTKRNDYNVLNRRSKIYLKKDGWMFEQDNQKIIRENNIDKLLTWEKGFELFTKINNNECLAGSNWWTIQQSYWEDVRVVWNELYSKNKAIEIKKSIDSTFLWEKLFKLGDEISKRPANNKAKSKEEIRSIIETYLNS